MSKIKQLENKKLLKELEFIESDFEYKTEIISEADTTFINKVNDFLERHPELKDMVDAKMNKKMDEMIKEMQDEDESESNDDEDESEDVEDKNVKSDKIKKLFREIVKLTHPDKIKDKKLNDLYIKATKLYEENNLISIYAVCAELNILYESDESDNDLISDRIGTLKERIDFMESTYTWCWYKADESKKDEVLMNYIRSQLQ